MNTETMRDRLMNIDLEIRGDMDGFIEDINYDRLERFIESEISNAIAKDREEIISLIDDVYDSGYEVIIEAIKNKPV